MTKGSIIEEPLQDDILAAHDTPTQTETIARPSKFNKKDLQSSGNISPAHSLENSIAPFNPSSQEAQDNAIRLLSLTPDDVLFDLGCGDGRLLITAAKRIEGIWCVGIELNPMFVQRGRAAIAELPPAIRKRVQIRQGNLMACDNIANEPVYENEEETDSSHEYSCSNLTIRKDATAIYLYLLPNGLARFKTEFLDSVVDQRMNNGKKIRIVAFMFRIHGWDPVAIEEGMKGGVRQYLYEFGSDPSSSVSSEAD